MQSDSLPRPLACGRIIYTNDLPVYAAFDAGAIAYPGTLESDVPAGLNAKLLDGRLEMSPVSAFTYAAHPETLALLPDLCIGSRNAVWSVVCISREPLGELDGRTVAVTAESASGRNLLRVLLERRFGVSARFETVADPFDAALAGSPALLIGDRAIDAQLRFPAACVHDLGELWHAWTGLDMVYAVWAVRRATLSQRRDEISAALQSLLAARAWGAAHMQTVIEYAQQTHPRPRGAYEAYYNTLNFDFDAKAQAGLERYIAELHAIGAIPQLASARPEVLGVSR